MYCNPCISSINLLIIIIIGAIKMINYLLNRIRYLRSLKALFNLKILPNHVAILEQLK